MNGMYKILFVIVLVIGLLSAHLIEPYNNLSLIEISLGMVIMAFITLKSAGRQHKHGLVSQWTNPGKFISMKFDNSEKRYMMIGLVMVVAPLLSFFSVMVIV